MTSDSLPPVIMYLQIFPSRPNPFLFNASLYFSPAARSILLRIWFNLLITSHFHSQYQRAFTVTNSRSVTLPTVTFAFTPFYTCAFTPQLHASLFPYISLISSPILRYLLPYYLFSFLFLFFFLP